jgi:serine protease inhibitor
VNEVTENAWPAVNETLSTVMSPPPPVTVVLDEPFLFVLRDTTTNTPLFVGSVVRPTIAP